MTTFWKPRLNVGPHTPETPVTKVLGNMVYVLWCRCDLCHDTGPSTLFAMYERGEDAGQLCGHCDAQEHVRSELEQDGWVRLG